MTACGDTGEMIIIMFVCFLLGFLGIDNIVRKLDFNALPSAQIVQWLNY